MDNAKEKLSQAYDKTKKFTSEAIHKVALL